MKEHIFLIGFMGTGKSSVSKLLADSLEMKSLSMDEKIEEVNNMTIKEMFACFGEQYFRMQETQVLEQVCHYEPTVIDCGGGLPTQRINRNIMKAHGKCVWFKATPETIYQRLKHDTTRPLLQGCMNPEYIGDLMEKRATAYGEAADITIDTDGKTLEEIANEILAKLKNC